MDYSCAGRDSDSYPAPTIDPGRDRTAQPTDGPTATPPAGTDFSRVGAICASNLNGETRATLDLIWKGGPFPYPKKDGSTFEWRDHDPYPFPRKEDGYYREWTVPTPGESNRGKQRIVTGGEPADKIEDFYTNDHYDTFELIDYGC
ncbi:ribonuclease domain-containing protein [Streptomyces cellulosae]|uniref:Ribonuclease domain-containing protein n=1 Tax=Streptomyces cellulosae TaxID=1968 RepID=A0ABW6JDJ5_STRCE